MEDNQNGRQPKWKMTKMEDDQNGRRPQQQQKLQESSQKIPKLFGTQAYQH